MAAMAAAEEELCTALVAYVGGTRLAIMSKQVASYLHRHYGVTEGESLFCHYKA
jgi:hypothetical protein